MKKDEARQTGEKREENPTEADGYTYREPRRRIIRGKARAGTPPGIPAGRLLAISVTSSPVMELVPAKIVRLEANRSRGCLTTMGPEASAGQAGRGREGRRR